RSGAARGRPRPTPTPRCSRTGSARRPTRPGAASARRTPGAEVHARLGPELQERLVAALRHHEAVHEDDRSRVALLGDGGPAGGVDAVYDSSSHYCTSV